MGRSRTSLERPDSLRPYELLLPRDAKRRFAEGGRGGNPFPPQGFEGATGVTTRDPLPNPPPKGEGQTWGDPERHLRGRIPSGRMSCFFLATPKRRFAEGGRGGNPFPPQGFEGATGVTTRDPLPNPP